MIEFHKYARVKNHYCICYFGPCDEYLVQLKLLKPVLEKSFPGLNIYFGCRDDKVYLFEPSEVMKITDIKARRHDFAYMMEIKYNGLTHPIEDFLNDSGVVRYSIDKELQEEHTSKCLIVSEGSYPTKNLEKRQIEMLKKRFSEEGYEPEVGSDLKDAGLVVGVESFALFTAAGNGIRTVLAPTGIGTRLYRNMFPKAEVAAYLT